MSTLFKKAQRRSNYDKGVRYVAFYGDLGMPTTVVVSIEGAQESLVRHHIQMITALPNLLKCTEMLATGQCGPAVTEIARTALAEATLP